MKKVLKKIYFFLLSGLGIPFFVREFIQRSRFSIILFHDPSEIDFKRHIRFIKRKYNPISFRDLELALTNKVKLPPKAILITLDDGHVGNYSLLDLIRNESVPVTIFLTSGIVNTGKEFWFKFVRDNSVKEKLKKLPNSVRLAELDKLGFNQSVETTNVKALTQEMIREMRNHVEFGSHTITHPCLPHCDDNVAWDEIQNSKIQLETLLEREIDIFSYPNGDYSERDVKMVREAGFRYAVTCDLGFNTLSSSPFLLKRQNCEDNASEHELNAKITGVHFFIRKMIGL